MSLPREFERPASKRVRHAIQTIKEQIPPEQSLHLGGDTWFFSLSSLEEGASFGVSLCNLSDLAARRGYFFIKPSIAIGLGAPQLAGERFLDDASIATYRVADGGKSFNLYLVGDARHSAPEVPWLKLHSRPENIDETTPIVVDWQASMSPVDAEAIGEISMPALLLDSEVIYSRSASEAIRSILRQQEASKEVLAFGGPVPFDIPFYRDYIRSTLALLREPAGPSFTVLSYVPLDEAPYSYAWLELCRRMSIEFSTRFAFSAFAIPEGQLRPFSYQVFDSHTVHLGLRSFSPQRGTPTMSSAILFRNSYVAERFRGEYLENWRRIGVLDDSTFGKLCDKMIGLSNVVRKGALEAVEGVLTHE